MVNIMKVKDVTKMFTKVLCIIKFSVIKETNNSFIYKDGIHDKLKVVAK